MSAAWLLCDGETSGCSHSRFRSQELRGMIARSALVIVFAVRVFSEVHDCE
jgi:hypothetical protein